MGITDKEIREIAIPLTGWIVSDDEAETARLKLLALGNDDFRTACRKLAWYSLGNESPSNKIARLLGNLSSSKVDSVIQRMLNVATQLVLARISNGTQYPYAYFVMGMHAELRAMGMGVEGALDLLDSVIADGKFNRSIMKDYRAKFGSDNTKGWDKAMHFVKAAYITYHMGPGPALDASYGKEIYDEIESWFGKDPEGFSDADIVADKQGITWGLSLIFGGTVQF